MIFLFLKSQGTFLPNELILAHLHGSGMSGSIQQNPPLEYIKANSATTVMHSFSIPLSPRQLDSIQNDQFQCSIGGFLLYQYGLANPSNTYTLATVLYISLWLLWLAGPFIWQLFLVNQVPCPPHTERELYRIKQWFIVYSKYVGKQAIMLCTPNIVGPLSLMHTLGNYLSLQALKVQRVFK